MLGISATDVATLGKVNELLQKASFQLAKNLENVMQIVKVLTVHR